LVDVILNVGNSVAGTFFPRKKSLDNVAATVTMNETASMNWSRLRLLPLA